MNARLLNAIALAAALVLALLISPIAQAHPGYPASALVRITKDGKLIAHVRHDALAFALNELPVRIGDEPMRRLLRGSHENLAAAMLESRQRFETLFVLDADGEPVEFRVTQSPDAETIENDRAGSANWADTVRLPIMLEFVVDAQLPPRTQTITLQFPDVMGDVIMTLERPGEEPFSLPLRSGEMSPEISVTLSTPPAPMVQGDAAASAPAAPSQTQPQTTHAQHRSPPVSALENIWRYISLGVTHIIPYGTDHMLFVLGLFLLSSRIKPLLMQVTTFTLAHSVTLTLATLGIVRVSSSVVEPIIAASIAFVAIENLLTRQVHPWRIAIVFTFGLVHGMGFAGALKDVGLPANQLVAALVSFNVGVEVGQLSVIALAMLAIGWLRHKVWYRTRITMPLSGAVALVGLWWAAQRALGI